VLAVLGERTFRDTYAGFNRPEDMDAYVAGAFGERRQAAELADPARTTLLAEIDDVAIGYTQLRTGPAPDCVGELDAIEILRFYVDRPWQGRGVAQALMAAAVNEARARATGVMWLSVWAQNQRAIAFYRKSGFDSVGARDFLLGADRQRDWVMARATADPL